jgi:uncharacterized protein (DUF1501 family)
MRLITTPIALVLCFLAGCALQRDVAGPVTDRNFEWVRVGFSVKSPPGRDWYRLPDSGSNRSSVAFQRGEGLAYAEFRPSNIVYIKGENVFAASTYLDKAVTDRKDKNSLASVLRNNLERCLLSMKESLENSVYDSSLGADCVKYDAASTSGRIPTENGEMYIDAIQGYFCLHPDIDNFGVLMQTSAFATVWTDIHPKEKRSPFFKSLRFLPVSSSVLRNITKR